MPAFARCTDWARLWPLEGKSCLQTAAHPHLDRVHRLSALLTCLSTSSEIFYAAFQSPDKELTYFKLLPWVCSVIHDLGLCSKLKRLELNVDRPPCRHAYELLNNLPTGLTSLHCNGVRLIPTEEWDTHALRSLKDLKASFDPYDFKPPEWQYKVCLSTFVVVFYS